MTPQTIDSQQQYQGAVFAVRTDKVRWADGRQADYDVVQHPGSVTLVPLDDSGRIWFVRQYRHPVGQALLELPAGTLEDEDPAACAERECREEIGMRPGELLSLGQVLLAPGYSSEISYLFLARDLQPAPLPADEDEHIEIEKWTIDEVREMVAAGDLKDAKSLAALWLALPVIEDYG
ncbi:MAG: NUDIX hydrolase [Anaerolineales bacterium]